MERWEFWGPFCVAACVPPSGWFSWESSTAHLAAASSLSRKLFLVGELGCHVAQWMLGQGPASVNPGPHRPAGRKSQRPCAVQGLKSSEEKSRQPEDEGEARAGTWPPDLQQEMSVGRILKPEMSCPESWKNRFFVPRSFCLKSHPGDLLHTADERLARPRAGFILPI